MYFNAFAVRVETILETIFETSSETMFASAHARRGERRWLLTHALKWKHGSSCARLSCSASYPLKTHVDIYSRNAPIRCSTRNVFPGQDWITMPMSSLTNLNVTYNVSSATPSRIVDYKVWQLVDVNVPVFLRLVSMSPKPACGYVPRV